MLRVLQLVLLLFTFSAWAADDANGSAEDTTGSKARYELGAHIGDLLPNQIPGVTEILGLGGVRGGLRLAPFSYAEAGIIMGNGNGVQWKNAHIDVRMDIPVENLVGFVYLGADTVYYKGSDGTTRTVFGGHAGGGIQALITGAVWLRGDMKFSISPGTSLYVGLGIVFRFGEGGA